MCNAQLEGVFESSPVVSLHPHELQGGEYEVDTGTAGSITLLLQGSLPCLLFSSCTTIVKFRGGTNTDMAPQIDYTTEVFRPVFERFRATFDYKLLKRGYYPRGGGEVHFRVQPVKYLEPINMMEQGIIDKIWGWSFVAGNLPLKVAQAMADSAINMLRKTFGNIPMNIEAYKENADAAVGTGSGITIVAQTSTGIILGGSGLGKRGVLAEQLGAEVANELADEILTGACVDKHSQDQIIIYMALARGNSQVMVGPITQHTKTAIHVCETMTEAKFRIVKTDQKTNIIHCKGIGLKNTLIS